MKSDYTYSKDIVYNNFLWPTATDEQKAQIAILAENVLNERKKQMDLDSDCSLAVLYGSNLDLIYADLRKSHRTLDAAVMKLYGFPAQKDFTEADCVAALMQLYQKLTGGTE